MRKFSGRRVWLVAAFIFLGFAASAPAATYYVATGGSDAADGSSGTPWATLQYAVDTIAAGDVILVRPGAYVGFKAASSGTSGAVKTIGAETPGTVLLNAPSASAWHGGVVEIEDVDYWVVEDFEVSGQSKTYRCIDIRVTQHVTIRNNECYEAISTGIFCAFSDYVLVEGNTSYSNGEHGIYVNNSSDNGIVRNNTCYTNTGCGIHMNGDVSMGGDGIMSYWLVEKNTCYDNPSGSAINCDGVWDSKIFNNLLYSNQGSGISLYAIDGAAGSSNDLVYNNTVVMPTDGRWALNIPPSGVGNPTGNKVKNNILYNASATEGSITTYSSSPTDFESDYNVVIDRFSIDDDSTNISLAAWQAYGFDTHSVISTPAALFVNAAGNDYHLKTGSPAIDNGTTLADITDDKDGNLRPYGPAYDIGCYEVATGVPDLSITTTSLADADEGVAYSDSVAAQGGVAPYSWSIVTGALPAGLSLNAGTGEISGTPTAAGTANFTVEATDSQGTPDTAQKALSIAVNAAGTVSVTLQEGLAGYTGWEDAWITEDGPTTNYGADETGHLQYFTQDRQLHRFDISSIPPGATISSGVLRVYAYNVTGGTPAVAAHRVLTHWEEMQVTYNNRLTGTAWGAAGLQADVDYTAVAAGTSAAVSAAGWMEMDITPLVAAWHGGSATNEGVVLREASNGHLYTYMSEYTTAAGLRPQLVVEYAPVAGVTAEAYGTFECMGVVADVPVGYTAGDIGEVRVYLDDTGVWKRQQNAVQVGSLDKFASSVFNLAAGTSYDFKVEFYDTGITLIAADIVSGSTRPEPAIPATAAEIYVSATGNDGGAGTLGDPYATLAHALSVAGAGTTIYMRGGTYYDTEVVPAVSGTASDAIVIMAYTGETPVLDGAEETLISTAWSDLGGGCYQVAYTGDPRNVSLVRTSDSEVFRAYMFATAAEVTSATSAGYTFAELLVDAAYSADGANLTVRVPSGTIGDFDVYVSKLNTAINLDAVNYYYIDGLTFTHYGAGDYSRAVYVNGSSDVVISNCDFLYNNRGVYVKNAASRVTVENNTCLDDTADWHFTYTKSLGVNYHGEVETGLVVMDGTWSGRGLVVRGNDIHGTFDGSGLVPFTAYGGTSTSEVEFYDNTVTHVADDFMEIDGYARNVRIFRNYMRESLSGISLAQALDGPVWIVRNVIADCGLAVATTNPADSSYESYPFKTNGGPHPEIGSGEVFFYHNTAYTDDPGSRAMLVKSGVLWKKFTFRNNIWCGKAMGLDSWDDPAPPMDWDYDVLYTAAGTYAEIGSATYANLAALQAGRGYLPNGREDYPDFVDASAGDYHLQETSTSIDQGVVLAGINEDYAGGAPELGAYEYTAMVDLDADGLPDAWEMTWFGDLDEVDTGDPDGDGWTNIQEYNAGTDPTTAEVAPPLALIRPHPRLWMEAGSDDPAVMDQATVIARTALPAYSGIWTGVAGSGNVANQGLTYLSNGDTTKLDAVKAVLATTTSNADQLIYRSLAFDWVYAGLTAGERATYAANLVTSANSIIDANLYLYGNYGIRYQAASAIAALAAAGDADVSVLWPKAYGRMTTVLEVTGDGIDPGDMEGRMAWGGGWNEGYDYNRHTQIHMLQYLQALRSAFGPAEDKLTGSEWAAGVVKFMIYGVLPDGSHMLPFADNDWPFLLAHDRAIVLMATDASDSSYGQYWLNNVLATDGYWAYTDMIFYDAVRAEESFDTLPKGHYFPGIGLAIFRSGWTTDDTYVAFKSSDYHTYHQNNGQNAFYIYKSAPLAVRTGVYDGNVHDHNVNYLIRTIAQNSITVFDPTETFSYPDGVPDDNDGGQLVQEWTGEHHNFTEWRAQADRAGTPRNIVDWIDYDIGAGYGYAAAEAGRAYEAGKVPFFSRQMLWLDPDMIVCFDRVTSGDANYVKKFQLHSPEGMTLAGDTATMTTTTAPGTTAAAKLFCKNLMPAGVSMALVGGTGNEFFYNGRNHPGPAPYNDQIQGLWRLEQSAPLTADTYFLNVMYAAPAATGSMPAAEIVAETADRVTVSIDGGATVVWFSKTGAVEWGFETGALLSVTTTSLADGAVGAAYSETLVAAGGVTPYSWAVVSGALPAGLSLNASTGEISGTATTEEIANFTVEVTDSDAPASSVQQALSITIAASSPTITTASLPAGTDGAAYSQTLGGSGGLLPYRWYLVGGTLPTGLSLDSATGQITGVCYVPGSFDITVKLWDAQSPNKYDTQLLTIAVAAADVDGDGLPDGWEMENFGDLSADPDGDGDSDGYINLAEYRNGTDPGGAETGAPYLTGIDWTPVGPGGGGAQYNPAIAPNNPDLMYGFCDMGGIYRSTDGGREWRMYRADEVQFPVAYSPVHCNPAFDPFDENVCFIGAWGALKRTLDGGGTFASVATTGNPTAIAVDRGATNVVIYADSNNRMYRSDDTGDTWGELSSWNSSVGATVKDIFIDASTPTGDLTIYAATGSGLYKSSDNGGTWAAANGDLPSTSISDFNAAMQGGVTVLYVAINSGGGIYRSVNGGVNWASRSSGINLGAAGHMELGICDSDPDVLYVGSQENAGPTIYKTVDGGLNWAMVLTDPSAGNFPPGVTVERDWMTLSLGWGWGEEPHEVEVSPTDPNSVAFAEDGRTWRSSDGGVTWFCCNSRETSPNSNWWPSHGFEVTTDYSVKFSPWDHDRVYINYTDMGFFRSEDRAESWRHSISGSPYRNTFYDCAFDPTIPGKMWAVVSNNHDMPHDKMLRSSSFLSFTGAVVQSADYGATWSTVVYPRGVNGGCTTSLAIDPTSAEGSRTLYVTVSGYGVYKSTDDGATWAAANTGLSMPSNMNSWMIKRMPDGTLYCALTASYVSGTRYPGALFKSTDDAATWTKVNTTQELPYIYGFDVDTDNQNIIYVATYQLQYDGQHGIYKTTDGGATWSRIFDLADVNDASIDPELHTRIYGAIGQGEDFWGNGGLYISEDSGTAWEKLDTFPFERYGPSWMSYDPDDSQIVYVTTFGGGVWKGVVPHATSPVAAFGATAGPADLDVTFDASGSTGDINTWYWEFGDGNVSFEANPVHTYAAAGTYLVTLTVSGPAGVDTTAENVTAADMLSVTTAALADGVVGSAYSETLVSAGGTNPVTWLVTAGALPAGLSLNAGTGEISGTATGTETANFTVQASDSGLPSAQTASQALSITVNPAGLSVTTAALAGGQVGVPYSQVLSAAGGVAPYGWSVVAGALPAGLGLNAGTGEISGTPTAYGISGFTVEATDSSAVPQTATRVLSITIAPATLVIETSTMPDGQVGVPYSETGVVSGGITPYTWSVIAGALPPGLSGNAATGEVYGTPTTYGTYNYTVQVEDSDAPAATASAALSITIQPAVLVVTTAALADGQVGVIYGETLLASGGTGGYTWAVTVGVLPDGVGLVPSTGTVSGTPTASGVFNFTVEVTDGAAIPQTATQALSITILPENVLVTTVALADGQVGVPYSETAAATGGIAPYSWSVVAGALPAGLSLNAGTGEISGTPTAYGTAAFTVEVADSQGVPDTAQQALSITIDPAVLVVDTAALADGQVSVAYSETVAATGGVTPYTWAVTAGALPTDVSLDAASGVISGTPSAYGTFNFTVQATDSNAPAVLATADLSITVAPVAPSISTLTLPDGVQGVAYSQTVSGADGATPYTWSVFSGTLPTGLGLNAATGEISGTPSAVGSFAFVIELTDSWTPANTATQGYTVDIAPAPLLVTTAALADGTVAAAYSETLSASGGITPYSWAIIAGELPAGLTLNAGTGEISGVPVEDGTFGITVEVTDSDTPASTTSQALTLTINSSLPQITTLTVPDGTEGAAYSSTLLGTGGVLPYRWYVMGGALPEGLALDRATGEIAGVPYESGAFTFTVKVWDAQVLNEYDTQVYTLTVLSADADADGMGDGWEVKYFGDLSAAPAGNADTDGYFNITEYRNGTDPTVGETAPPYLSGVVWQSVGLGGGGSQANPVIAPNNPDLMFGICDMGGFYRSTDGGRHWDMVNGKYVNGVPPYAPDDCGPEFHRQDELILLASRNGGLARTADGGFEWTVVSAVRASAIAFHAGDSSYALFAGEDDRLYESTDAGATWAEETGWLSVGLRIREVYADPTTATGNATLYASTASGVYKSTDGGTTWTAKNMGLAATDIATMDAGMADGSLVLYCLVSNAVYKTTDGAQNWVDVTADLPTTSASGAVSYTGLGVAWSDADVAYVGSDFEWGPSIHKTTDGGASWTLKLCHIESPTLPVTTTVERDWLSLDYDWGWGGPPWNVNVCPTDPERVTFAEYARTFRSDNGGDHWFCSNVEETAVGSNWWRSVGFETTTCYKYVIDPRQGNRHYICYTDIGFARSEDSDATWRWSATGSPWQNTFYEIACDPTADGRIWGAVSNSHDIPGWAKVGQDPNTFTGGVVVSTDWGVTWTDVTHATGLPAGAVTSILVDPTSPEASRTVYAVVFGKGVYKSTDGGATWVEKNTGLTMGTANTNIYRIERTPDGTLYAAITHRRLADETRLPGGLFKSADGGDTWTMLNTGYDLYYIQGFSIDPTDSNRIYVGLAHPGGGVICASGIVRSTDGGATWENPLSSIDTGVAWHVVADPEEPSRVWAAVNCGYSDPNGEGLYMSDDYAATWTKVGTFPFTNIGGIRPCFDPADSQNLYVTTYGGGVFKGTVLHATAPVAVIGATAGPGDNTITFDSTASTGDINTWYWDFGDGTTSFEANPVHTYAASGSYTVTLTVQGLAGTDTATLVVDAAAVLSVTTATLSDGVVGSAYSETLASAGGTAPVTWSITAGALPGGLTLDGATGAITGVPTVDGTFNFTVEAVDAVVPQQAATANLTITVYPAALVVATASLPDGQVSVAYSQTLTATGGIAPYTWAIIAGALPAGLSLDAASGVVSGTATTVEVANFTVEATDSSGVPQTATADLSITVVAPPVAITTLTLPDGQVGVAYSQTLTATGGIAPYSWSVVAGVLPAGFSLNAGTGEISGTPTAIETVGFTVEVADSQGVPDTAQQTLSITVDPAVLVVTTAALADGQVGVAYSQTLSGTGGVAPYSWSVVAGALPAGFSLNAGTGEISGTPTAIETVGFTVEVADSQGVPDTAQQALSINVLPATLVVTTAALADGQVGVAYSQTLSGTGGVAPYSWSVVAGALPAGFSLNAGTGEISGTPTAIETANFTVEATDSGGTPQTAQQALSINVLPATLVVTTAALADGQVGAAYSETLSGTGGVTPYTWAVTVGVLPDGVSLNAGTGEISGTPTAYGTFAFTVEATDTDTPAATATKALSITIQPAALVVTTAALADGQVGVAYSESVSASGGVTPYTWAVTVGVLPDGLLLDSATGVVSGTPSAYGTFAFTVEATDSDTLAATATADLSITITAAPLVIDTASLPNGLAGVMYNQTLAASGGVTPYTWAITAGALPGGLSLDAATGVISGIPPFAGTFAFTVEVTDSDTPAAVATADLSITIDAGADSDGDGLPDAWEIFYFGDLSQSTYDDFDDDGWYEISELIRGTDPTVQQLDPPDLTGVNAHPRLWMRGDNSNPFVPSSSDLSARRTAGYAAEWTMVEDSTALWNVALTYLVTGDIAKLNTVKSALGTTTTSPDVLVERALAYDWVYEGLTTSERTTYAANLIDSGYSVRGGAAGVNNMYSNVGITNERAAAMAALAAAGDDARAQALFDLAYNGMLEFRGITGDGFDMSVVAERAGRAGYGGGWPEGFNFDRHASRSALQFDLALRSALEQDFVHNSTYWRDKTDWLLYGTTPDEGHLLPWDDNDTVYLHRFDREEMLPLAGEFGDGFAEYWLENINSAQIQYSACVEFIFQDKTVASSDPAGLPRAKLFEGLGLGIVKSGWTTSDTMVTFRASDWFTYHQHNAAGAFMIMKTAPLTTKSGVYDGMIHDHYYNYVLRTISYNGIAVEKPGELFTSPFGTSAANDGGQAFQQWSTDPKNVTEWRAQADRTGLNWNGLDLPDRDVADFLALESTTLYDYMAAEYGRAYAEGKVPSASRQVLYVEPDWVIVFDRVTSLDASYQKKFMLHSGDTMSVAGDDATIGVTSLPGTTAAGKLFMKKMLPAAAPVTTVGGSGYEFWYDGANHPASTAVYGDQIAGKWRLEEAAPLEDTSYFLNVFHADDYSATAIPTTEIVDETVDTVSLSVNEGTVVITFNKTGPVGYSVQTGLPVQITTTTLPDATQDALYSAQVQTAGGTFPLSWSVTAGALPAGVSLDAATGIISGTPSVAGTFDFTVGVTDAAATSDTQALTLVVLPTNHPPVISGIPDVLTDEDTPVDNAVDLWAYAVDADTPSSGLTYTLVDAGDAAAGVTLDSNRYIDVAPAGNWYGTTSVTVEVSDGQYTSTDTFDVVVGEVNDPPALLALPDVTTDEDVPVVHAIDLWAYAIDVETAASGLGYSIAGVTDASAGVSIEGNRYVNVAPAANWNGTATVTIEVTDGLATATSAFDVIVGAVNDQPAIAGLPDVETETDVPVVHAIDLWPFATDVESTPDLLVYSIDAVTAPEAGVSIEANRYINVNPNAGWTGSATVTIRVSDGALFDTDAFVVTVSPPAQPPVFSLLPDVTTDEDTPVNNAIDLWAYADDADTLDADLTFTITNVSDANAGVSLDSNRFIDVNPLGDWNGTATVTVEVTDGTYTDSDVFVVTVNAVNDAPEVTGLPDVSTPEDTPVDNAIDLWTYASDVETAVDALTYTTIAVSDTSVGVTVDSNRWIDISPDPFWHGTSTVTIRVSDGDLTGTDTFVITVTNVDTPPVLTHTPVATALEGDAVTITATVVDPDSTPAVTLYYRMGGAGAYTAATMANTGGDTYEAVIPAATVEPPTVEYYITAADATTTVQSGPHTINVTDVPDTEAPVVSSLGSVPTRVMEAQDLSITLSGLADDSSNGASVVTHAEYFLGADPGQGSGTAMAAADGAFDSMTESLIATVDTSTWVTALSPYVINVRARDEDGNWSVPVNLAVQVIQDEVPPSAITDLTASAPVTGQFTQLTASVAEVTSEVAPANAADMAVDGNPATYWSTTGSSSPKSDYITLDLGGHFDIGKITLYTGAIEALFPPYFKVRISDDDVLDASTTWETTVTAYGYIASAGAQSWQCAATQGRFVRIEVLESGYDTGTGLFATQLGEIEVYEITEDLDTLLLTWTAPGDDGPAGQATAYDIRYSTAPITAANFDAASSVVGEPAPGPFGTIEGYDMNGLAPDTLYYVAMKTADEVYNWSAISNVVQARTAARMIEGVVLTAPADETSMPVTDVPIFTWESDQFNRFWIEFSNSPAFPASQYRLPDGRLVKTLTWYVGIDKFSWKPNTTQWNRIKGLASGFGGTVYWRIEAQSTVNPALGIVYSQTFHTYDIDQGELTLVSPGNGAGLPIGPIPTFTWDYVGTTITQFQVQFSNRSDFASGTRYTRIFPSSPTTALSYTLTASQWRAIKILSKASGGLIYWRVTGKDASGQFKVWSNHWSFTIGGGTIILFAPVPNGDGTVPYGKPLTFSWDGSGTDYARFSVQLSTNPNFYPARSYATTPVMPPRGVTTSSYMLTDRNLSRLTNLDAGPGDTIYWRVVAQDAARTVIFYTPPEPLVYE